MAAATQNADHLIRKSTVCLKAGAYPLQHADGLRHRVERCGNADFGIGRRGPCGQIDQRQNLKPFVGESVTVRFACEKGFLDVNEGTEIVIDAEKGEEYVLCPSPDFQQFGPVHVEVRVKIGDKTITNTTTGYKFHSVTDASKTVAFGPGLLAGSLAGTPTEFVIKSFGANGAPRDTGGDKWSINFADEDGTPLSAEEVAKLNLNIEDKGDGTYLVTYTASAGKLQIGIDFDGTYDGAAAPAWSAAASWTVRESATRAGARGGEGRPGACSRSSTPSTRARSRACSPTGPSSASAMASRSAYSFGFPPFAASSALRFFTCANFALTCSTVDLSTRIDNPRAFICFFPLMWSKYAAESCNTTPVSLH